MRLRKYESSECRAPRSHLAVWSVPRPRLDFAGKVVGRCPQQRTFSISDEVLEKAERGSRGTSISGNVVTPGCHLDSPISSMPSADDPNTLEISDPSTTCRRSAASSSKGDTGRLRGLSSCTERLASNAPARPWRQLCPSTRDNTRYSPRVVFSDSGGIGTVGHCRSPRPDTDRRRPSNPSRPGTYRRSTRERLYVNHAYTPIIRINAKTDATEIPDASASESEVELSGLAISGGIADVPCGCCVVVNVVATVVFVAFVVWTLTCAELCATSK